MRINILFENCLTHFIYFINETSIYLWEYFLIYFLLALGIILTIYHNTPQTKIVLQRNNNTNVSSGINPIKLFIANLSASVGLGNIIFITGAVMKSGILVVLWLWIGTFLGMIISYSEVFLALKNRRNINGKWTGGMYFLINKAFGVIFSPIVKIIFLASFLFYTIEVYQFSYINEIIIKNVGHYNNFPAFAVLIPVILSLVTVIFSSSIYTFANISVFLTPLFLTIYILSALIIIFKTTCQLGLIKVIQNIFYIQKMDVPNMIIAAYTGLSCSMYTGDVGIGQNSMVQCESSAADPKVQARLSALALITDASICTLTSIVALMCRGLYNNNEFIFMHKIFEKNIPYGNIIFSILTFLVGFTTISAYSSTGQKISRYFSPRFLLVYRILSILIFSTICILPQYFNIDFLKSLMLLAGGILVFINISIIFILRKEVKID